MKLDKGPKYFDFDLPNSGHSESHEFNIGEHYKRLSLSAEVPAVISKYLMGNETYRQLIDHLNHFIFESLEISDQSINGFSLDEQYSKNGANTDKLIRIQRRYILAITEFIRISKIHPNLIKDRPQLKRLTIHFYRSFYLMDQYQIIYFDLNKFLSFSPIPINFIQVLNVFRESAVLQSLSNKASKVYNKVTPLVRGNFQQQQHTLPHLSDQKNRNVKSFKELFRTDDLYRKALSSLINNGFIIKENGKLNWVFTPTKEYTTSQTVIALFVVLQKENYFVPNTKVLYKTIENGFGISIHKSTYSRSYNAFVEDYNNPKTKNYSYIALFKHIL